MRVYSGSQVRSKSIRAVAGLNGITWFSTSCLGFRKGGCGLRISKVGLQKTPWKWWGEMASFSQMLIKHEDTRSGHPPQCRFIYVVRGHMHTAQVCVHKVSSFHWAVRLCIIVRSRVLLHSNGLGLLLPSLGQFWFKRRKWFLVKHVFSWGLLAFFFKLREITLNNYKVLESGEEGDQANLPDRKWFLDS